MTKIVKAAPPIGAKDLTPAPVDVVRAIKALHAGTAESAQQQLALKWIIREFCAKAHFAYHESDRDTAFHLGRQFVGEAIIGAFNAELSTLRSGDD